jgi:hypothetical protein
MALIGATFLPAFAATLGEFSGASDIGGPKRAGSAQFDAAHRIYTISGGGKNMWFTNDAFHFVWKKVSGERDVGGGHRV